MCWATLFPPRPSHRVQICTIYPIRCFTVVGKWHLLLRSICDGIVRNAASFMPVNWKKKKKEKKVGESGWLHECLSVSYFLWAGHGGGQVPGKDSRKVQRSKNNAWRQLANALRRDRHNITVLNLDLFLQQSRKSMLLTTLTAFLQSLSHQASEIIFVAICSWKWLHYFHYFNEKHEWVLTIYT